MKQYIIDNDIGIGFVAINKCASSSIQKLLYERRFGTFDGWERIPERMGVDAKQFSRRRDLFRFAVVRNPFDRIVSAWIDKAYPPYKDHNCGDRILRFAGLEFADFVAAIHRLDDEELDEHLLPQVCHLYYGSVPLTDRLIRLERLESEWQSLSEPLSERLPERLNPIEREPYRSYYCRYRTIEMVEERYALDFQVLDYEF